MTVTWGVPLATIGRFDAYQLQLLGVLGATVVEDLFSMVAADPEPANGLMDIDLWGMMPDLIDSSPILEASSADLSDINYYFGAALPSDVTVPEAPLLADLKSEAAQLQAQHSPQEPGAAGMVDFHTHMLPVRNQGERSTCVPHACLAVAEYLRSSQLEMSELLSPQHLYFSAKACDGHPTGKGTLISVAMQCLQDIGVCTEQAWPYSPSPIHGNNEGGGPPPMVAYEESPSRRCSPIRTIVRRSSLGIRDQLDAGWPVALSVLMYAASISSKVWTNTNGKVLMPLPGTRHIGNHAICVVGYNSDPGVPGGGYFIFRNSWGQAWAPSSPYGPGYGSLPYAYVDKYGLECMSLGPLQPPAVDSQA